MRHNQPHAPTDTRTHDSNVYPDSRKTSYIYTHQSLINKTKQECRPLQMDRTLTVQLILGDVCQEYEMHILIHYNEVPTLTFDKLSMTRQEFATEFNCEKTKMTGLPGGGTISIIG